MNKNILHKIIQHKKSEVEAGKYNVALSNPEPSQRSLKQSILEKAPGLILECKSASPSKGIIIEDYKPEVLARLFAPYAAAISVLTDQKFFNGSLLHLQKVSNAVTLPVLCKDFIISTKQILAARVYGADAILLMLSVLSDEDYLLLTLTAKKYQLDILTEVHTKQELKRALKLNAEIIGINNRDLKTLSINLQTTRDLLPLIPDKKIVISESGIQSFQEIYTFSNLPRAANGFLIGSHLGAAKKVALALRKLRFGAIKICGLTRVEDARLAFELGASYGGIIFSKNSPRYLTAAVALTLVKEVELDWVGVFTMTSVEEICQSQQLLSLSVVQIHWQATANFLQQLRLALPATCEIWLWQQVTQNEFDYCANDNVDRLLLEPVGMKSGGNGIAFDWNKSTSLNNLITNSKDKSLAERLVLAGGIGVDNIIAARKLGVGTLDVNSKVESAPGIKDPRLLRQLFKKLESLHD